MVIPFTCVRIRSREARNPRGHFGGVPFRHVRIPFREIATSRFALLAMTVAKCRYALFAGGRGTPLPILSNVSTNVAYLPAGVPCRRDEGVPPYRGVNDIPSNYLSAAARRRSDKIAKYSFFARQNYALKNAPKSIDAFCFPLITGSVFAAFTRGFCLLLSANGRLLVVLFATKIAHDVIFLAFSLETFKRAFERLVLSDFDCGHDFTPPLFYRTFNACLLY